MKCTLYQSIQMTSPLRFPVVPYLQYGLSVWARYLEIKHAYSYFIFQSKQPLNSFVNTLKSLIFAGIKFRGWPTQFFDFAGIKFQGRLKNLISRMT